MLMFELDVESALEFYKRCKKRRAKTEEARVKIMVEMAKEGKIKSIMETKRTADQVANDMAKNYGKVLYLKGKKKDEKPD